MKNFLTNQQIEQIKSDLRQIEPDTLASKLGIEKAKFGFVCPFCHNGAGKNGTGIEPKWLDNHYEWACFKCDPDNGKNTASYDNIDLIANFFHLDPKKDFLEIVSKGSDLFLGYVPPDNHIYAKKKDSDEKQLPLIRADIQNAQNNLDNLPKDQRRGLSGKTLSHFGFGFLDNWAHPKCRIEQKKINPSRRIIIPTVDGQHYNAVMLPCDRKPDNKPFWKMHAGQMALFNPSALHSQRDLILVVEGEFDAASIWQAFDGNISVVATLGVTNWKKTLLPCLDGLSAKKFLILFDAEGNSRKQADFLRDKLIKRGFSATCRFYYDALKRELENGNSDVPNFDDKIDPNQILQLKGSDYLKTLTESIISDARADFDAAEKEIANKPDLLLEQWQKIHGKINPDTLPKIIEAKKFLDSLSPMNISAEIAKSDTTLLYLATCSAFGLISADKFYTKLIDAQNLAAKAIKLIHDEGADFVTPPDCVSDLKLLLAVSRRDIKADVEKLSKKIFHEHEDFQKREKARIAEEQNLLALQLREQQRSKTKARLDELRKLPPSTERNAEIVRLIRNALEWQYDSHKNPVAAKATQANADLLLTYDPHLDGIVGINEFTDSPIFLKQAPWRKRNCIGQEWTDRDDAQAQVYLRRHYKEFNSEKLFLKTLTDFSQQNSFNEVEDFLDSLPAWDGVPRAETLFIKFLKAQDTPFNRAISLNWLMGLHARLRHPGCDYQYCLVLQAAQRTGKSRLLRMLGGDWGVNPKGKSWHVSLKDSLDDSHAIDTVQAGWIVELEEARATSHADINAIKAFVSAEADTRRKAYARRATTVKRHSVLAITTNSKSFLKDPTGNARFLVLQCNQKKLDRVQGMTPEYIRQVHAELIVKYNELFKDGFDPEKLQLPIEYQIQSEQNNENYLQDDGMISDIYSFLNKKIPYPIIWELLSREEHQKFYADGKIAIGEEDLRARFSVRFAGRKNFKLRQEEFDTALQPRSSLRHILGSLSSGSFSEFIFYGDVFRQHICAAEIINEAFPVNDKRKSPARINDLLDNLEGWSLGKRIDRDPEYKCQKNVFWRDPDNIPDVNSSNKDDDTPKSVAENNTPENSLQTAFDGETLNANEIPDFYLNPSPSSKVIEPPNNKLPFDPNDLPFDSN